MIDVITTVVIENQSILVMIYPDILESISIRILQSKMSNNEIYIQIHTTGAQNFNKVQEIRKQYIINPNNCPTN